MEVHEAHPGERDAALNVLDAAMLRTGRADEGTLLVAVDGGSVVGSLLLVGDVVDAVAVRRRRRGQGIGSALVRAAAERRERLVAEFAPAARPFYESLGFRVERVGDGGDDGADARLRGTLTPA